MIQEQFRQALKNNMKALIPKIITSGTVTEVDKTTWTCAVQPHDGSPVYYGVRLKLKADSSDIGIIPEPKIGSDVLIGLIYNNDQSAYVLAWSELEELMVKTSNNARILFKKDGTLQLNGDANGGLIIIQKLLDQINRLETKFNELVIKFNAHSHASSGAAPPATPQGQILPQTTLQDIESKNVVHG